ncbi:integrase [Serratia marcescens]|uniref:Integrase n=1 Tax=Serratia marcescens TaxID=615 RepID=A0A5C7BPJ7_SERMA|nr:integrase [Serratia marcescens]TXE24292.1 integrase [Serratia marcescens]TXE53288.1 integrase [Serratia marcescens]
MPNTGAHLVDLLNTSQADAPDIPVSIAGERVLSRYRDNIWDLSPYLPTKNSRIKKIRFDVPFADDSRLTDVKHILLLESAKRFLYVRWRVKAPHSRKYISARTILNNWTQLRALLIWMVAENIRTFGELTPQRCLAYAATQKKRLKGSTQIINLQILTTYYDLTKHLVDQLPEYPWGTTAPIFLAGNPPVARAQGFRLATTEVIPSRILRMIVQTALDYVENRAGPLLAVRDKIFTVRKLERKKLHAAHRARYPSGFSSIYSDEKQYLAVRLSHLAAPQINKICSKYGVESIGNFNRELVRLRTACHVICAIFSGMRESELASLEVGCFSKREGFDGEIFCWLHGLTYKLERDPTPTKWMVPEIVGVAVDVATKLGEPARSECASRIRTIENTLKIITERDDTKSVLLAELDEAKKHRNSLLFTERENGRILALGGASASNALREFSQSAGAIVEQQDMQSVIDREKVKVGEIWPLTSHQFRRTFAVFVARNLLGDVRYLREHFKHWSIDMTLYYARHDSDVDMTVFSDVLTERDELQAIIMEKWIKTNVPLSGGGGARIMTFRNRGDVKTVSDMREFCRRLGEDVYVRGTGHSWCLASGNGCGGHGLYDSVLCTTCGESIIDSTHLSIWRGIRQQQIEVLQCPDLGVPSWQRCVEHLRKAERTLEDLGDVVTPHQVPPSAIDDGV